MKKELYSKSWHINTAKTAEAFILLDFVITIYTKSYNKTHRNIIVYFDNSKVWKMSNGGIITFNQLNQESSRKHTNQHYLSINTRAQANKTPILARPRPSPTETMQ